MAAWRNWDWQALAIIATIIGAAYLLGRDTVSPDEVHDIVTNAVGAAVAEAVRPLATRDEVRDIARDAVGAAVAEAVAPLATRDAVSLILDAQRSQAFCLSFLYASVQDRQPPQQFGQDPSPCDLTALNPLGGSSR